MPPRGDRFASEVFIMDGCLAMAGGIKGPVSTTTGSDEPCHGFLLPQWLERLPKSRVFDITFLFSEAVG